MSAIANAVDDFIPFHRRIAALARSQGDHVAVIDGDRSLDYAGLHALTQRVAASLQRDGAKPQKTVAICASSSLEYVGAYLGALAAGMAVAPLAPSSTPEQLMQMLADCEPTHLFIDAQARTLLQGWALAPGIKRVAFDDPQPHEHGWQAWLAGPGAQAEEINIQPDWPFNIIYSSGTTGEPKGIVQPHQMRHMHVARGEGSGFGPDAVALASTPLYSNTTLVSFFACLGLGGTVVLMPKFDATRFLELAEKHRVTHAMLVPVQYQRLMSHPEFDRYDLSSFRMKFSTSAPFNAELKSEVLRRWPGGLTEYYGMTEGGGTFILHAHLHPTKLHTVGQPAPGHDIRLIDEEGRELPPGPDSVGEVVGHSPAMMSGYFRRPSKTAEAEWFDASGKRFIRTGDVGRFDEDGFLILMDRRKDMIISGGFNVYPSDLEAILRRHEAVLEAAVAGVTSKSWGETPVAFVVARPGKEINADELRNWVNKQVGKTQRLAAVELIQELPRSAIGKVLKRELRERFGALP